MACKSRSTAIKQAKAEEDAVYILSPAFLLYFAVDSAHVQWDF